MHLSQSNIGVQTKHIPAQSQIDTPGVDLLIHTSTLGAEFRIRALLTAAGPCG